MPSWLPSKLAQCSESGREPEGRSKTPNSMTKCSHISIYVPLSSHSKRISQHSRVDIT